MNVFDHPYVKRAMDFVNLKQQVGLPDAQLFLIIEFAVWSAQQMEAPSNVVPFERKQSHG